MNTYPKIDFKHPSSIVLFNLLDILPFPTVHGRTILSLLSINDPFLENALTRIEIFCYDDYTYTKILNSGFQFSDTAKRKQVEKREKYKIDTLAYNLHYQSLPEMSFPNVKLYKSDYNIGFGTRAGMKVEEVLKQSPSCIENMIHTLFWFGLTREAIHIMKAMESEFVFLSSTFALLEQKYDIAPDFMKGIRQSDYYPDDIDVDLEYESEYAGTWAHDQAGFSDDDIEAIFDGNPDAYWNID